MTAVYNSYMTVYILLYNCHITVICNSYITVIYCYIAVIYDSYMTVVYNSYIAVI